MLLIVFVTRIRWRPLKEAYENDDMCSMNSLRTYCVMFYQLFLLSLDMLVTPLALFVIVTYYRSASVIYILKCKKRWHEDEFFFHVACIAETLIVLNDICLMVPMIVFLLVTVYRARYVIRKLIEGATYKMLEAPPLASAPPSDLAEVVPLDAAIQPADEVIVVEAVREEEQDPPEVQIAGMDVDWRFTIWLEFANFILDLPFFIMSVLIVATIWRATALWKSVRSIEYDRLVVSWYVTISLNEKARYHRYYRELRRKVWSQFYCLIVDIALLVPFSLVVATMYRLPSVLIQLFAKAFETKALIIVDKKDENALYSKKMHVPLLQITNVHWEFPERGGPRITIRAKRMQSPSYGSIPSSVASMRFATDEVHLQVLGTGLWQGVESVFGSTVAAVGKGMLPLCLKDNVSISLAPLSKHLSGNVEGESEEVELWVQLDFKNAKRTSVLKNVKKLFRKVSSHRDI
jgi:hypothetical protein